MTAKELQREVERLQTELAYATKANTAIIEQQMIERSEYQDRIDELVGTSVGLAVENSELRTYVYKLESFVASVRCGQVTEACAALDAWLAEKKKRAA